VSTSSGLKLILVLNALAAYALGPIPIPWLATLSAIAVCVLLFATSSIRLPPGTAWVLIFSVWALGVTLGNLALSDPLNLPERATTGYSTYVTLRFVQILSFLCLLPIIHKAMAREDERILEFVIQLGVVVSLFSIYVYLAQTMGFWEPPRTRMGTSGEAQATRFTYAFHRAMGSFREPSHLAEWLVLPCFLSLANWSKLGWVGPARSILMFGVMALTGSLTGFGALGVGLVAAWVLTMNGTLRSVFRPMKLVLPIILALGIFAVFKSGTGGASLIGTVVDRALPMLEEGGMKSSNRNYIYEYLERSPPRFWGRGVGNANLEFSAYAGSSATASFLSLYLNTLYATGAPGFAIMLGLLLTPIVLAILYGRKRDHPALFYLLAAYTGWLLVFGVHAEELSLSFALVYGLLTYVSLPQSTAQLIGRST